jgi:hypothetical protein
MSSHEDNDEAQDKRAGADDRQPPSKPMGAR